MSLFPGSVERFGRVSNSAYFFRLFILPVMGGSGGESTRTGDDRFPGRLRTPCSHDLLASDSSLSAP